MDANTQIAFINDIFTGMYVILTLIIVIFTYLSHKATSKALEASRQQSMEAIAAINKQIAASEHQAREALHNQHKPVIVPLSLHSIDGARTDARTWWLVLTMQNKGTGIALNTWGVVTKPDSGEFYRFENTLFLVPDRAEKIDVKSIKDALDFMFSSKEFNGYSIYPEPDTSSEGGGVRLLVTYNDAFGNKYLVVFDHNSLFGWRQIREPIKINQRLDEYLVEKRLLNQNTINP